MMPLGTYIWHFGVVAPSAKTGRKGSTPGLLTSPFVWSSPAHAAWMNRGHVQLGQLPSSFTFSFGNCDDGTTPSMCVVSWMWRRDRIRGMEAQPLPGRVVAANQSLQPKASILVRINMGGIMWACSYPVKMI